MDRLQNIETDLYNLLLKCGVREVQSMDGLDNITRRKQMLKMAIAELAKLDTQKDTGVAMSMDPNNLSDEERIVNSFAHSMGVYCPKEYR